MTKSWWACPVCAKSVLNGKHEIWRTLGVQVLLCPTMDGMRWFYL